MTPGTAGTPGIGADNLGQGTPGPDGGAGQSCDELVFDGSATGMCLER